MLPLVITSNATRAASHSWHCGTGVSQASLVTPPGVIAACCGDTGQGVPSGSRAEGRQLRDGSDKAVGVCGALLSCWRRHLGPAPVLCPCRAAKES